MEYLAAHPEAGYAHDHPGCAWRPYAEYYDAHGIGNGCMSRADMFCDLTYSLAFRGPSRLLPEGIAEQVVAAFVANDRHDGTDPFVPAMVRMRTIQTLLASD